jgi:hypothetical protein
MDYRDIRSIAQSKSCSIEATMSKGGDGAGTRSIASLSLQGRGGRGSGCAAAARIPPCRAACRFRSATALERTGGHT